MAMRGCNEIHLDRATEAVWDRNNNVSRGTILSLFPTSALKFISYHDYESGAMLNAAVKAPKKALRVSELIELFSRAWSGLKQRNNPVVSGEPVALLSTPHHWAADVWH